MRTRPSLALASLPLVLALAACGSSTAAPDAATDSTTPVSAVTPVGSGEPLLVITNLGGYVPMNFAVSTPATLVITSDGTVYLPSGVELDKAMPAYQGMVTGKLSADQLAELLADAKADGLLTEAGPDVYERTPNVTDMPTVTVTITTPDGTVEHSAYALGFGKETGARKVLADFVAQATDLAGEVATDPVEPTELVVTSFAKQPGQTGEQRKWPVTSGVDLGTTGCDVVSDPATLALLATSDQSTVFTSESGQEFTVAARVAIPGDRGCPDSDRSVPSPVS